jgi:hypothetical protein
MKHTLGRVAPVLALALAAGACDSGLTDLNVDPNNPPNVSARAILPEAEQTAVNRALGSNFNLTMMGLWSQSFAKIQYIDEDRYRLRSTTLDTHWQGFYASSLLDFQKIVEQGDSLGYPNWSAVGRIMREWTFQIVTDTWGRSVHRSRPERIGGLERCKSTLRTVGGGVARDRRDEQRDPADRPVGP